jgi:hypothetical protein
MSSTSFVTLSRADARDVGHRQIYVRIDDAPNQTLLFGDSIRLEVPPGQHHLKANNTLFWKSVPFEIKPNEHLEFTLVNQSSTFGFGLLALLGAAPLKLVIERRVAAPSA